VLRTIVVAAEDKKLNAVRLTVTTRWPSVSLAIAQRLVNGVNQFNLDTRRIQAKAEREFVEARTADAERALREAEDRLQSFMQRNRSVAGSPELTFAQDRLQRDVALRQSVLTSLAQRREEARLKEVRDVPVVTVIESPRLAVTGQPRRSAMRGVLGAFVAGGLGLAIALVLEALAEARKEEPQGIFRLLQSFVRPRASR
jgi:uncharacterized protein involved in exopolysaccharide biosynthesis